MMTPLELPNSDPDTSEYAELKRIVRQEGLLDQQPGYYARKISFTLGLLVLGLAVLATTNLLWLQLVDAAFLAIIFGQIGFIGHDAGHRQIVRGGWKRDVLCFLHLNLLIGLSYGWWIDKHYRHHNRPNQFGVDPDIKYTAVAFCEEHARNKRSLVRFLVRHQAYTFVPLLSLVGVGMRLSSIKFLLRNKAKYHLLDSLLLAAHFTWYFTLIFYLVGGWRAVLFIAVQQGVAGLYMGAGMAANHIGMPMIYQDGEMDGLRQQVVVSRNIKNHPLTDFWYGGLNFQVEHHLFPLMARNKMRAARQIVKRFCQAHSITYYEVGVFHSYREILRHLRKVSSAAA